LRSLVATFVGIGLVFAQVSPHEKTEATIAGKKITIEYGRPYVKGRKIFGEGTLVPYGKVWRIGADQRTKLTIDGDMMIGSLHVVKGSYSLWAIPGEKSWTLLVNKAADGWGAQWDYDSKIKATEYGRTEMTVSPAPPTEQLTIAVTGKSGPEGKLTITWEKTQASVDLYVH